MKTKLTLLLTSLAALPLYADIQSFDFKDAKGVNNVVFLADAPLESINGTAHGVSGVVKVDPEKLTSAEGKIVVDATTLTVPNPMMLEHMQSDGWLDVKKHPEMSFELKEVTNVKKDGAASTADAKGIFTLKGVSKEITVPVKVTYLPGKLADRTMGKVQGDLLVLRSTFTIKRSDYGIKPGENLDKVADDIQITLSLAGAAPKS